MKVGVRFRVDRFWILDLGSVGVVVNVRVEPELRFRCKVMM